MPISRASLSLTLPSVQFVTPREASTNTATHPWLHSPYIRLDKKDPMQLGRLESALRVVGSAPIGRELLDAITVVATQKKCSLEIVFNSGQVGVIPHDTKKASNSIGTGSLFLCGFSDAGMESIILEHGISQEAYDATVIFHELVHVYHNLVGERVLVSATEAEEIYPALLHEEARTVGLGVFSDEYLSENKFREQIESPRRDKYAYENALVNDDGTVHVGFAERPLFPLP